MRDDSVLREVRAARDEYARSFGYDLRAIVAHLRDQNDRGDWPVVRLAPRRPVVAPPKSARPPEPLRTSVGDR